jgi:adenylylsulfate kinase
VKSTSVVWQKGHVSQTDRERSSEHCGMVLWFSGLSGAGKSTLAYGIEQCLFDTGYRVYALDGDNMYHGLCSDLGFSDKDQSENIRRVAESAKLFVDAGFLVVTAFISPFRQDCERARAIVGDERFHEVYIRCPLEVCEERDVKYLYQRARRGEIGQFTGIRSPYEPPKNPEVLVDTSNGSIENSLSELLSYVAAVNPILVPV